MDRRPRLIQGSTPQRPCVILPGRAVKGPGSAQSAGQRFELDLPNCLSHARSLMRRAGEPSRESPEDSDRPVPFNPPGRRDCEIISKVVSLRPYKDTHSLTLVDRCNWATIGCN